MSNQITKCVSTTLTLYPYSIIIIIVSNQITKYAFQKEFNQDI